MAELPAFPRTEVWHALVVHFPIALLLVATVFKGIGLAQKREVWALGGSYLLYLGLAAAWLAVYTGSLADPLVVRELCDPVVLEHHEQLAFTMSGLFSGAALLDILGQMVPQLQHRAVPIIVVVLMVVATATLSVTGHLGASLVYQQAAAVHVPSDDCHEFVSP